MKNFTLDTQIEAGGALVGTPDEIKAIIRRFESTIGKFEHASLQINFGTLDFAEAQKSMRLFAREVIPAVLRETLGPNGSSAYAMTSRTATSHSGRKFSPSPRHRHVERRDGAMQSRM